MQAAATRKGAEPALIRNPKLAERLDWAADQHPHCPPKHFGRLEWFREQLTKHDVSVSPETVRKWLSGENSPRQDKVTVLAEILGVDIGWLQFGVDANVTPREQKARSAVVNGLVNVVAGLIQADGGFPAFPSEDDKRAEKDGVDLYAIIKGAQYAFHIAAGEQDGDKLRFTIPANHENVVVLGVVREGFSTKVFEIAGDVAVAHGKTRNRSVEMVVSESDLKQITSFASRL